MENLISTRVNIQSVPESYVLPPQRRPGSLNAPLCKTIPVVDLEVLAGDRKELIQQIMKASQEYGFFQLTSHGVSEELMHDVMMVAKEFHELPVEEKASFCSEGRWSLEDCRLQTSLDYAGEKVHFWRDNLRHPCHPLGDYIKQWPETPARYREVVGHYAVEVRKLSLWLLDLISEGLGLEPGYFQGGLSQRQTMTMNHYPACPDPTLVLGLPKHGDPYLLTLLNQGGVLGLQVLKDEQWLAVEPIPNAFVVNINYMLQVISNGKLKSAEHRVVTNSNVGRTTVASFIIPSDDILIEPARSFGDQHHTPIYKAFKFPDFAKTYITYTQEGKNPLEHFVV